MQPNYSSTQAPTTATSTGGGAGKGGGSPFTNPQYIEVNDSNSATWGAGLPGDGATITGGGFAFPNLPNTAVIDGIQVSITGSQTHGYGSVAINVPGVTAKDLGVLNGTYGGPTDLWGLSSIPVSAIPGLTASASITDLSGGQAIASVQYMTVTIYWHVAVIDVPADVPTRVVHKVYSRAGKYLGDLPNVSSKLAFPQDINTAGASLDIQCAHDLRNIVDVSLLLTEDGFEIDTEDGLPIYAEVTTIFVTPGADSNDALFKNSNRIKSYLYNYWHPNGKLVFSGQINRIGFSYGNSSNYVNLKVLSDGYDLANFVARGYPFNYTTDVSQTTSGGNVTVMDSGPKGGGWTHYGQTFKVGAGVTNIGQISLYLNGAADVTITLSDAPNGNVLGSITQTVNTNGAWVVTPFQFAQLINVVANGTYFIGISLGQGQSILVATSTSDVYANGSLYVSNYSGGSGGGLYTLSTNDMYFVTASGLPTTTTTYTGKDPVTGMMSPILTDYNNRGGYIKQRSFTASGKSLTYTFNVATINDVIKTVLKLAPTGYFAYVDLGTAQMDMLPTSTTPDFTITYGKDIEELDIALTIEQLQNDLLFTGGPTAAGAANLFKEYKDSSSAAFFGQRLTSQTDNRVTIPATADAIGQTFIAENATEGHETTITVYNGKIDITTLTPGKTIGFRNFGNFIDNLVLQIVRREPNFSDGFVKLTVGQLPVRMSDEIQRITQGLQNQQTLNNPTTPS